jgi:hypothetical protein
LISPAANAPRITGSIAVACLTRARASFQETRKDRTSIA